MNRRNFFTRLGIGLSIAPLLSYIPTKTRRSHSQLVINPNVKKIGTLKAKWSKEMENDLRLMHNIDLEKEITCIIQQEMDKEILTRVRNITHI